MIYFLFPVCIVCGDYIFTSALQFLLFFYLEYLFAAIKKSTFPISAMLPSLTTDHTAKNPKCPTQLSPEPSETYSEVQKEVVCVLPGRNARMVDEQKLLEERLQRLEQEISHRRASSNRRSSAGRLEEPLEIYSRTERELIEWKEWWEKAWRKWLRQRGYETVSHIR